LIQFTIAFYPAGFPAGLFFAVKQGNFADKGANCCNVWYNHSADAYAFKVKNFLLHFSF
jgi:hypothetical protein